MSQRPESWPCATCGHPKSEHGGFSGPNSNRQWFRNECTHGAKSIPPYRVGGCDCGPYKPLPRWRVIAALLTGRNR